MARLVLICGGDDLVAHKLGSVTTIGRAPLNHIIINDPAVSAQHALIARSAGFFRLQDLHSTNGTQVNGVPVSEVELKDGDKIRFGSIVAVFAEGRRET
jgi:pSer/pThr/pTyr-binding forkhead associated (FHA) protein